MLKITSLDDFRSKVAHKPEIREMEIAPGLVSFCYMVSMEDTFDSPEARECRGIVFDKATGEVVGRPLHKFFNVNERAETRPENLPVEIFRLMDKRDGSMIHTVKVGDTFRLKSKKSFDSDVAKMATAWINKPENKHFYDLCEDTVKNNETAIFEFTAPDARIVLPYNKAELKLLHVRDNKHGLYWNSEFMHFHFGKENCVGEINLAEAYEQGFDLDVLIEEAESAENIEGWIVQFENGEMVKIKTDWYLKRHRAMTFLRERDIAQLVLDEGLDDVKSLLVGDGVNITDILQIEKRVVTQLNELQSEVVSIMMVDGHLERKEFAIKYKDHSHFGLLMAEYVGKNPDYKAYFERNILREQYSLRQLALMDSVAEPE